MCWLAYSNDTVIFPLWIHENNENLLAMIAHQVIYYRITHIAIWYSKQNKLRIDKFIDDLKWCVDVPIVTIDEAYTTVIAQVITWDMDRSMNDCIAAMEIVKRFMHSQEL